MQDRTSIEEHIDLEIILRGPTQKVATDIDIPKPESRNEMVFPVEARPTIYDLRPLKPGDVDNLLKSLNYNVEDFDPYPRKKRDSNETRLKSTSPVIESNPDDDNNDENNNKDSSSVSQIHENETNTKHSKSIESINQSDHLGESSIKDVQKSSQAHVMTDLGKSLSQLSIKSRTLPNLRLRAYKIGATEDNEVVVDKVMRQ